MPQNLCRVCHSSDLRLFIDLGLQPVAHDLLSRPDQPDRILHPLTLHQCQRCGFIQNNDPIDPELLYKDYNFCFSAWKPQPHIQDEVDILHQHMPGCRCLEIGCNDGIFLLPLRKAGFRVIMGVEPNPFAAAKAKEQGFDVTCAMLTPEVAVGIYKEHGSVDLIIARQVLEHIPDLTKFFESVKILLAPGGKLLLELPDADAMVQHADCSMLWEEHPNHFTKSSIEHLLGKFGFTAIIEKYYDFSGGSLAILAEKSNGSSRIHSSHIRTDFASRVLSHADRIKSFLKIKRENSWHTAIYGSGARACTFVNGLGLKDVLDVSIDDQLEKQGLFMAGAKIPIVSLQNVVETPGNWFIILAVNHENEEKVNSRLQKCMGNRTIVTSFFAPHDCDSVLTSLGA